MTKSDLKDFMVVETRDGNRYMVAGHLLVRNDQHYYLDHYDENLTMTTLKRNQLDIVKVYEKKKFFQLIDDDMYLIWERQEAKEMTLVEIEVALGYPVKIVESK